MSHYHYQIGNLVKYNLHAFARIEKINSFDGYNAYELTVLKSYPNDIEKKVRAKENEIMPIGLWGMGAKLWDSLGFILQKNSMQFVDEDNKIVIKELALDFPTKLEITFEGRAIIGLTRIFCYLIDKESEIIQLEKNVIEKAKAVKNENDLKKFVSTETKTSYVHDIQNFYSANGAKLRSSIEKALLGF